MFKIILAVAIIGFVNLSMVKFNQYCARRFGNRIFTTDVFFLTATTQACFTAGVLGVSAINSNWDKPIGIAFLYMGGFFLCWMIHENVKRTNFIYGIGGALAELGLFIGLAWISLPLMVITLLVHYATVTNAEPVINAHDTRKSS